MHIKKIMNNNQSNSEDLPSKNEVVENTLDNSLTESDTESIANAAIESTLNETSKSSAAKNLNHTKNMVCI